MTDTWAKVPHEIEEAVRKEFPGAVEEVLYRSNRLDDEPIIQVLVEVNRERPLPELEDSFLDRLIQFIRSQFQQYTVVYFGRSLG